MPQVRPRDATLRPRKPVLVELTMDIYHLWFDKKPDVSDVDLCDRIHAYLGNLKAAQRIADYRITRCKLGFTTHGLPEFHVMVEVRDLTQLESAFQHVAARSGEIEQLHAHVNQHVLHFSAALYRDFPDAIRERGSEKF
jgi:hypothetical protein